MIRRPPRSTLDRSSAASDVYKRQEDSGSIWKISDEMKMPMGEIVDKLSLNKENLNPITRKIDQGPIYIEPVSYTHLRAHETVLDLVCRLLLEKNTPNNTTYSRN